MRAPRRFTTKTYLPDLAANVEAEGTYHPAQKARVDPNSGKRLPGEPAEVGLERVLRLDTGAEVSRTDLTKRDMDEAFDALVLASALLDVYP